MPAAASGFLPSPHHGGEASPDSPLTDLCVWFLLLTQPYPHPPPRAPSSRILLLPLLLFLLREHLSWPFSPSFRRTCAHQLGGQKYGFTLLGSKGYGFGSPPPPPPLVLGSLPSSSLHLGGSDRVRIPASKDIFVKRQ